MNLNKKGFTLIELLAVIVILAVIALIATPLIMGVIDDAKKGSAQNSAYGYVKALENTIATEMVKDTSFTPNATQTVANQVSGKIIDTSVTPAVETPKNPTVSYKGANPTAVNLVIVNGTVKGSDTATGAAATTITISGYTFKMNAKGEFK